MLVPWEGSNVTTFHAEPWRPKPMEGPPCPPVRGRWKHVKTWHRLVRCWWPELRIIFFDFSSLKFIKVCQPLQKDLGILTINARTGSQRKARKIAKVKGTLGAKARALDILYHHECKVDMEKKGFKSTRSRTKTLRIQYRKYTYTGRSTKYQGYSQCYSEFSKV